MLYSGTICPYLKKVIVILYCPLKEAFLSRNVQLGSRNMSVVGRCPLRTVRRELSAENCPLYKGFLIRIFI